MKLFRSLAVYLYIVGKVVYGASYFKKLEGKREALGDAVVDQKIHDYAHKLSHKVFKLSGSTFVVKGAENLPTEGTALYVANHQSYMDAIAMMALFKRPVGFVVKDDLVGIPFFNKWLEAYQCVPIVRGEARKGLEAILKTAKLMKNGRDMMLFPEGTRSKDGSLLPFKAGSLKAAQRGNAMIVPIAIEGASKMMPRGSYFVYPAQVTVTVMPAIPAETVKELETVELARNVRNQIATVLGQPLLTKEAAEQESAE